MLFVNAILTYFICVFQAINGQLTRRLQWQSPAKCYVYAQCRGLGVFRIVMTFSFGHHPFENWIFEKIWIRVDFTVPLLVLRYSDNAAIVAALYKTNVIHIQSVRKYHELLKEHRTLTDMSASIAVCTEPCRLHPSGLIPQVFPVVHASEASPTKLLSQLGFKTDCFIFYIQGLV